MVEIILKCVVHFKSEVKFILVLILCDDVIHTKDIIMLLRSQLLFKLKGKSRDVAFHNRFRWY